MGGMKADEQARRGEPMERLPRGPICPGRPPTTGESRGHERCGELTTKGAVRMRVIGFVGLGTMGAPMALNLLNKGYEVILCNRTRSRAEAVAEGQPAAVIAGSPAEVAREADVVVTMLGDDASVEAAYFGAGGLFAGVRAGLTFIDCSTVSPPLSRRLGQAAEARLADFLDAPVTGSQPAAERAELTFIVGGREESLDAVRDILSAMGRSIVHMGPTGTGSETKLANNTVFGIHAAALAEGLAIVAKAGIDPEKFFSVLAGGGAAGRLQELKRDKLLQRDYTSQFSLKFMLKDLRLASAFADELRVPTPVLSGVKELFQIGEARGLGELDLTAILQCYEEWAGITVGGGLQVGGTAGAGASRVEASAPGAPATGSTAAGSKSPAVAGTTFGGAGAAGSSSFGTAAASAATRAFSTSAQGAATSRPSVPKPDDRRRAPRVALNIPLHISVYQWEQEGSFSGQQIEATLYDLSEGGLQVRSPFPLAADMFVVIHFPQEADLPPITGRIIRVVADGDAFRYGCMLSGLPPFVRIQLEDYLRSKSEA